MTACAIAKLRMKKTQWNFRGEEDTVNLQRDIDRLGCWARKWGMRFQPVKCNMMQLTRKRIKKIHASYTLEGTDLKNIEIIRYLGVTITNDLRWNTHVSNVCTKANRTLRFLRAESKLTFLPLGGKTSSLQRIGVPGPGVWQFCLGPPGVVLQEELERVQKRAARFVTGNYKHETGSTRYVKLIWACMPYEKINSMTGILGQLKLESLKKRRKDKRLMLLYKGHKCKASIPTNDLIPKTRRGRSQHSRAFQYGVPLGSKVLYKCDTLIINN